MGEWYKEEYVKQNIFEERIWSKEKIYPSNEILERAKQIVLASYMPEIRTETNPSKKTLTDWAWNLLTSLQKEYKNASKGVFCLEELGRNAIDCGEKQEKKLAKATTITTNIARDEEKKEFFKVKITNKIADPDGKIYAKLMKKVAFLNRQDDETLHAIHKKVLNNGQMSDTGGAGLGHIDAVRKIKKDGGKIEMGGEYENGVSTIKFYTILPLIKLTEEEKVKRAEKKAKKREKNNEEQEQRTIGEDKKIAA